MEGISVWIPLEGLAIPKNTLFFADGYHRCAFLTAIYKRLIKYFSNQLKKVNVSAPGFELEQMCKEYDLDFRRLGNDDFFSLLKHFALLEFQIYIDLPNSIQGRHMESLKCPIKA